MNHGPRPAALQAIADTARRTQQVLHEHPKRVAAAVLTLLLGTGVTAFGVAPLTTVDPNPIAQHLISEPVQPLDITAQIDALDAQALQLHRTDLTRSSDTFNTLLTRLGIDDEAAAQWLRQDGTARLILLRGAGKQVSAVIEQGRTGGGRLVELVVRGPSERPEDRNRLFSRITVRRTGDQFSSVLESVPLHSEPRLAMGTINTNLFAAADDAQLPDNVTSQVAEIFGSDIDFRRELRRGDRFMVQYQALFADGEPAPWSAGGRVLAARFVNRDEVHEAYWFEPPGQKGGYFGADGQSKNRLFLASPLAFSRVTSGFSMRFHPILQTWKAHLGVDYGAPTGTPVRAVGDGVVAFAGWQNGYGNVVHLSHAGQRETVYAHLSRLNVKTGQKVAQSDVIGAVGATGWATGPHLHFEVKLNGRQTDPIKIARASEAVTLPAAMLPQFMAQRLAASEALASLERSESVALARAE